MTAIISTPLMAETIYNGDVIQGRKVITKLDVKDFDSNSVSELFFEPVTKLIQASIIMFR